MSSSTDSPPASTTGVPESVAGGEGGVPASFQCFLTPLADSPKSPMLCAPSPHAPRTNRPRTKGTDPAIVITDVQRVRSFMILLLVGGRFTGLARRRKRIIEI